MMPDTFIGCNSFHIWNTSHLNYPKSSSMRELKADLLKTWLCIERVQNGVLKEFEGQTKARPNIVNPKLKATPT
jgi:hypothetical protein